MSASLLKDIVEKIPVISDERLLVGFNTADDGAVYKLRDDLAIIQTLDFFPPLIDDMYVFGQIAAANALSDVAAMGGKAVTALNILAFPDDGSKEDLHALMRGGAEKVAEAGAVLCGGHSIADSGVKYGLSVMGTVHPDKILQNNTCKIGDKIILTKPLGVGIVTTGYKKGKASKTAYDQAITAMTTLNTLTMDIACDFPINATTDVTGFGFLGHLNEMVADYSIIVDSGKIMQIDEALQLAKDGLATAGGKKNRQSLQDYIDFSGVADCMLELLFDPQTSGGLLISLDAQNAEALVSKLDQKGIASQIVAEVVPKQDKNILIT